MSEDAGIPAPGNRRQSTYRSYQMHVESYIVPRLGTIRLQKLTPDSIGAMYRDLLDDGKVHRAKPKKAEGDEATPAEPVKCGLSPVSGRHAHAVLHRALRDAVKRPPPPKRRTIAT
jgi:hypothetical protein